MNAVTYRWGCILLDQDTENPPFEPARFFTASVFAETKDQVIDALAEEYPWCDIIHVDRMVGWKSEEELLAAWQEWNDESNYLKLAPHGRGYDNRE